MTICRKHFSILFLLAFGMISCDNVPVKTNNDQTYKAKLDTITRFFPEEYEITKEDTLVDEANGLRVVVQKEVLMNQFVTFTYEMDSFKIVKDNYRDYSTTILLYRHDTLFCKQSFTKADFPQIEDADFYKKAITQNTWLENFDNTKKTIKFSHAIAVPETDWAYDFSIIYSDSCKFKSELENIN